MHFPIMHIFDLLYSPRKTVTSVRSGEPGRVYGGKVDPFAPVKERHEPALEADEYQR